MEHVQDTSGIEAAMKQWGFGADDIVAVVAKTEGGYRQVQTQVLAMRREGLLPWAFITDGTRWQRKPSTWLGMDGYVAAVAQLATALSREPTTALHDASTVDVLPPFAGG